MPSARVRRNCLALIARATVSLITSTPSLRSFSFNDSDGDIRQTSPKFWHYIAISSFLVLAGGVFAGHVLSKCFRGQDVC